MDNSKPAISKRPTQVKLHTPEYLEMIRTMAATDSHAGHGYYILRKKFSESGHVHVTLRPTRQKRPTAKSLASTWEVLGDDLLHRRVRLGQSLILNETTPNTAYTQ